jgi:hypothetical protein
MILYKYRPYNQHTIDMLINILKLLNYMALFSLVGCILPMQTDIKIDFNNNIIKLQYSNFFHEISADEWDTPDSVSIKYEKEKHDTYCALVMFYSYFSEGDSFYVENTFRHKKHVKYKILKKKIEKTKNDLKVNIDVKMEYKEKNEEVKESVFKALFENTFVENGEIIVPNISRPNSEIITTNGSSYRTLKNKLFTWDLKTDEFHINMKDTTKVESSRMFLNYFNKNGDLMSEKVPEEFFKIKELTDWYKDK